MIWFFIAGLILVTVLSLVALTSLIFYFDPFLADKTIFFLVYLTLFFCLTGGFSLVGLIVKKIKTAQNLSVHSLGVSFLWSLFLSLILVVALAVWAGL